MKEILGSNLIKIFKDNNRYNAKCTYENFTEQYGKFEVWEMDDKCFENFIIDSDIILASEWNEYVWYCYSDGLNLKMPDKKYTINGVDIMAWDGEQRDRFYSLKCNHCSDMMIGYCRGLDDDISYCFHKRNYNNLFSYLETELKTEIGDHTMHINIYNYAVDLAKYNQMTLGTLFTRLQ